jgi:hypothetical protein
MSDKTLSPIYASAPSSAFPDTDLPAFGMLMDFSSGEPVLVTHLVEGYTHNFRSPLQQLEGDSFENWLIHRIKNDKKVIIGFQLDWRHLSGDRKLDEAARKERKKDLKEASLKEATQGKKREPKAIQELIRARSEYFEALGEAANDSSIEEPEKS